MDGPIESIVLTDWDNPKVRHAVNRAFMDLNGEWDPTDEKSRSRLLAVIRDKGFPEAELVYDPEDGSVPRIHILPEGRS